MSQPMDAAAVLKMIKEKEVKFVDLRFTDPRGKMQHLTMDISQMGEDAWADGLMFDGSSIAGWKAINESDMVLHLAARIGEAQVDVLDLFFRDHLEDGTRVHWLAHGIFPLLK